MTRTKSPGAVAALGASEIDQLGRRVVSEINSQPSPTQLPFPCRAHRRWGERIVAGCASANRAYFSQRVTQEATS
jgi:hypothetical protein